ncbi:EYxxD motif small membrane protein [Brevibacillus migulae]|nr:EYxxD motif small membrane protein [Brevibacillus migulae]
MLVGTPLYEWASHNFFVLALAIGSLAAIGYFLYHANAKKGRYRQ